MRQATFRTKSLIFGGLYSDLFYLVDKMCFEKVGSFKDRTQAEEMAKRSEDE